MTTPQTPAAPVPGQEPPSAPVTTPQGEAQEKQPAQPQYVTKEEMDQVLAEAIRRVKQSDRDRGKQIEGKLDEIKGLLAKAGTPIAPEQEARLRAEITNRIDSDDSQPQGQSAVPTASQPAPVDKFLADVFAEAGAIVTPNDPEWKGLQEVLDKTWNDPQGLPKVLVAATKAANAKAARTAAMQETAPARVGGGGTTTTGAAPAASAAELWQAAYSGKK